MNTVSLIPISHSSTSYNIVGGNSSAVKRKRKVYSEERKIEIVKSFQKIPGNYYGKLSAFCRENEITAPSLYQWVKKYGTHSPPLTDESLEEEKEKESKKVRKEENTTEGMVSAKLPLLESVHSKHHLSLSPIIPNLTETGMAETEESIEKNDEKLNDEMMRERSASPISLQSLSDDEEFPSFDEIQVHHSNNDQNDINDQSVMSDSLLKAYEKGEDSHSKPNVRRQQYSTEEKKAFVNDYLRNKSKYQDKADYAMKHGLQKKTFGDWLKSYEYHQLGNQSSIEFTEEEKFRLVKQYLKNKSNYSSQREFALLHQIKSNFSDWIARYKKKRFSEINSKNKIDEEFIDSFDLHDLITTQTVYLS